MVWVFCKRKSFAAYSVQKNDWNRDGEEQVGEKSNFTHLDSLKFLAYKDKKKWIKMVRKAVCFIKIHDSICCNALVKRDGKQQKDE